MNESHCSHCKDKILIPITSSNLPGRVFCCQGCQSVFEILSENNLTDYYKLREDTQTQKITSVKTTNQKFKFLDQKEFQKKYAKTTENTVSIIFYLENVHCLACLWLIEKLPKFEPNVLQSQLNMSKSTVEITIKKDYELSKIAKTLETLGYPPHPILEDNEITKLRQKEDHADLIKIAISFFCSGNIMLLAFSIYAGAEGRIKEYFDWISLILFLPVIFYSAIPFCKNTIGSLRSKTISIDFPIVLALILGGGFSIINVFINGSHVYFDSLATLVFLILTSRFLLKKSQQKGLAASEINNFFTNIVANRQLNNDTYEEVFASFLKTGDIIKIFPGETIPADGIVMKGNSSTNNSLLTGEIIPQSVKRGDSIFSGTVNLENELLVQIDKTSQNSKLGKILKSVEKGWNQKTKILTFTDKIAKYFISIVTLIAIFVFSYFCFKGEVLEGAIRSLTLIIITCPCALGLATPLSLTLTLSKLAKKGIIVKDELVIEKALKIKNIFFDKTGTLTEGKFRVHEWESKDPKFVNIFYQLEKNSQHPIAKSIVQYLSHHFENSIYPATLENHIEIPGIGPQANFESKFYQIKPILNSKKAFTKIGLFENDKIVASAYLNDSIKPKAQKIISFLQSLNFQTFLLSGDNQKVVSEIGKQVGIQENNIYWEKDPEEKNKIIQSFKNTIMLGDGANDAISLSHSDIGIAVHGSVDISLRASDVFFANNNLQNIPDFLIASKETISLIKRNLIFSLCYNILGCILAINGFISPLVAAILMPLSSFTVLLSTVWGTKRFREIFS